MRQKGMIPNLVTIALFYKKTGILYHKLVPAFCMAANLSIVGVNTLNLPVL